MAESDNADKTFASFLKDMSQLSASEESILQGSPSLNQYSPASIQSTFSFSQGPPARATSSSQMSITFQEFQRRDVHYSSQYYCLNTLHHLSSSFTAENIKNSTSLFKFQTQRRVPSVLRYAADLSGGAGKSMSLGSSRFKANSGYVSSSTSWTRAKSRVSKKLEEALSRLTPNYSGNSLSLTTTSTKQQQRRRKRADATHSHGGSPLSAEEKLLLKHLCKLAVWDQMEDLAIKYLEMSRLLMVEPNNGKSKSIGSDAAGTVDVLFLRYILLLAMVKGMENLCLLIIESSASSYISYDESILQNSILQNYSDFKERELMLQKVNLKAKQHHCNNYFPTFFHIATSLGLETVLLAMLTSPHANASQSSQRNFPFLPRTSSVWNYFTPLHVAIGWNQMGNTSLVEIILSSSCQDLLQVTDLPFDEIYVLNIPLLQGLFKLRDQYREDILVQQKVSSFDEPRSPETKKKIIVKEQQQLITLEDFCRAVNNILILRLLSRNSPGRRRKSISTLQPTQSLENNEEGFIVGANAADLALKKAHTFDASPLTTLNITNTGIITRSSSAGTPSSLESNGSTDLEDSLSTASNTSSRKSASLPKKASSLSRWFFKKK